MLSFVVTFERDGEEREFAYSFPYAFGEGLLPWLATREQADNLPFFRRELLCLTPRGNRTDLVTPHRPPSSPPPPLGPLSALCLARPPSSSSRGVTHSCVPRLDLLVGGGSFFQFLQKSRLEPRRMPLRGQSTGFNYF